MRSYNRMALASAALIMAASVRPDEDAELDVTSIEGEKQDHRQQPVRRKKDGQSTLPHQGKKERERRLRQMAKPSRNSKTQ